MGFNEKGEIIRKSGPQRQAKKNKSRAVQSVEVFRDRLRSGGEGPAMVVLPTGRFRMGDLDGGGNSYERPVHTVTISRRIAMGQYPVTFEDYDRIGFLEAFLARPWSTLGKKLSSSFDHRPYDYWGWGRGRRPVIMVSWHDAKAYCAWLSEQTGKRYRLPSESEWEYAARAGTETRYSWGDEIGVNRANGYVSGSKWSNRKTSPVGSFAPNGFGLYDMHGNVCEWVEDHWHDNYEGAPSDGSAWTIDSLGGEGGRVWRGGSYSGLRPNLYSAARGVLQSSGVDYCLGFRLVQDLNS